MATPPPPPNRELLRAGQDHYRAQQYEQAIEVLSRISNDDSQVFAQALAVIGRSQTRLGRYEEALEALRFAGKMAPSALNDYYLGECYYHQGDRASAEERLEAAVALDNKLTDAYILLGTLRRGAGNLDGAIQAYNLALRNDPKAIAARFQLAQAAYDLGDLQRATSQAFMIVQQQEDFAPVHLLLGHCALRLNDFRQAAYEYCRVLQLSEPTLEVYEGLGRAFSNLKDFEQALKAFEAVIILNPDHEMSYVAGARLAERIGDTERATRFWTAATRFPKFEQMARDSLARLGTEAPPPSAPVKRRAARNAKPAAKTAATVSAADLPRNFFPPAQIDRSALPHQRPASSMPTAPLTTHAAGTLSLASRQPAKTQPLPRPVAAPRPLSHEEEKPSLMAAFSLDGLLNSAAGVFSSWMAKAKKPEEPYFEGGETVADLIARRAQERAMSEAPEEPAPPPPKPRPATSKSPNRPNRPKH